MENTEKLVTLTNEFVMEQKKENLSHAVIEVIENGPLKITGNILLRDLKRDTIGKPEEISICLCGKSGNKPYCDDSHKK